VCRSRDGEPEQLAIAPAILKCNQFPKLPLGMTEQK